MVEEYGVDVGYSPEPGMLRAPDIAVGNVPKNKPGWVAGVPALAIEYADEGQDEDALERKIDDLLGAGTQYLWVVRLSGPRRVEVHEKGKPKRVVRPGAQLKAPGVLQNPVLVEALYDRDEAERATLRNLLQRQGYASVDALLASAREEGVAIGREEGAAIGAEVAMAIRNLCEANGLPWSRERAARFSAMSHAERLDLLELLKREGRWD